jgi:hypothetical protein
MDRFLKYYNIFSFLVIRYILDARPDITLLAVYKFTTSDDSSCSWWDVFDGLMWILSVVASMILWGFIFNYGG